MLIKHIQYATRHPYAFMGDTHVHACTRMHAHRQGRVVFQRPCRCAQLLPRTLHHCTAKSNMSKSLTRKSMCNSPLPSKAFKYSRYPDKTLLCGGISGPVSETGPSQPGTQVSLPGLHGIRNVTFDHSTRLNLSTLFTPYAPLKILPDPLDPAQPERSNCTGQ
jgi:hypothetical protein